MKLFKQETQSVPSNLLKDKYGWPPFSILNTISWDWQRRRDEWETVIQDSTLGRDVKRFNATPTNTFSARGEVAKKPESISEFDPYLAELMYRWFSLDGDNILDPFAGGSVRGVVAEMLNRNYVGIDLNDTQVSVNKRLNDQLHAKYNNIQGSADWILGDSSEEVLKLSPEFDMVFTCPPYYNLERYTKDSRDLSNAKTYTQFLNKYADILFYASQKLKENSFFVVVVSEIRASSHDVAKSYYQGLVPDTIDILRKICSLHYYNEIILENNIGSLPVRAPKYFTKNRKIGRHHQNILVFWKGDLENIEPKFGNVRF